MVRVEWILMTINNHNNPVPVGLGTEGRVPFKSMVE